MEAMPDTFLDSIRECFVQIILASQVWKVKVARRRFLDDPAIHKKGDAKHSQQGWKEQEQELMQAWIPFAQNCQCDKCRKELQRKALIGEQYIWLFRCWIQK